MKWLFIFASIIAFLVIFGGFVRLTRSGLSIVEWNPVSGSLPPLSERAWQIEFAKYQQTPEFIHVNSFMTLEEYKFIFWMEWIHRFVARWAGLVYALPLFYFLLRKKIPWREFGIYFIMGMLFISQAFAGWYMVKSGLVERPSVSHYLLLTHLMLALALLGLALWTAFGHRYGFTPPSRPRSGSAPSAIATLTFILLLIQIAYGALTAGLKAGHVTNTWPLMFGQLIPTGIFGTDGFALINLVASPLTVVFIHRWFAFVVLMAVVWLWRKTRTPNFPPELKRGLWWLVAAVVLQIVLGILVVRLNVNIAVASIHQAGALILFWLNVFFLHRLRALDHMQ